jgi:hypothetical protein
MHQDDVADYFIEKEDASSPTAATESVLLKCEILKGVSYYNKYSIV